MPDAGHKAVRGGTMRSSVVPGGQRSAIHKRRAHSLRHGELGLPPHAWTADTEALDMGTMASITAGMVPLALAQKAHARATARLCRLVNVLCDGRFMAVQGGYRLSDRPLRWSTVLEHLWGGSWR